MSSILDKFSCFHLDPLLVSASVKRGNTWKTPSRKRLRNSQETPRSLGETGQKMERLKEVMTLREASEYLGISPDTLYKYLSEDRDSSGVQARQSVAFQEGPAGPLDGKKERAASRTDCLAEAEAFRQRRPQ